MCVNGANFEKVSMIYEKNTLVLLCIFKRASSEISTSDVENKIFRDETIYFFIYTKTIFIFILYL